jgi:hypothetical protein
MHALLAKAIVPVLLLSAASAAPIFVSVEGVMDGECGSDAPCSLYSVLKNLVQLTSTEERNELIFEPGIFNVPASDVPETGFPWPETVGDITVRSSTNDPDDVAIDRGHAGRLLLFTSVHNVTFQGIRFLRGGWAMEGDAKITTDGSLVSKVAIECIKCGLISIGWDWANGGKGLSGIRRTVSSHVQSGCVCR